MKKIVSILALSSVVFCIGGAVAYYNTAAFGYDNANWITFKEDSVQVLDFDIAYRDIQQAADTLKEILPDKMISI